MARQTDVLGNSFEEINGVNLLITSACGVVVEGNQFLRPQREAAAAAGAAWGEDPGALIFVTSAAGVDLRGNQVSMPGRLFRRMVRRQ